MANPGTAIIVKHWPQPWRFDAEGYNGGPAIFDANNQMIFAAFWPTHSVEETENVEKAMTMLGELVAGLDL